MVRKMGPMVCPTCGSCNQYPGTARFAVLNALRHKKDAGHTMDTLQDYLRMRGMRKKDTIIYDVLKRLVEANLAVRKTDSDHYLRWTAVDL